MSFVRLFNAHITQTCASGSRIIQQACHRSYTNVGRKILDEYDPDNIFLVFGIGNSAHQFKDTRHNVGHSIVRHGARLHNMELHNVLPRSYVALKNINSTREGKEGEKCLFMLAQNSTYMNRCGIALEEILSHIPIPIENFLLVYDDIRLPLGRLRLQGGKKSHLAVAHRGVQSVIEVAGTRCFDKLRVGVGQRAASDLKTAIIPSSVSEYVLQPFEQNEVETVAKMTNQAVDMCFSWAMYGRALAQNDFHATARVAPRFSDRRKVEN